MVIMSDDPTRPILAWRLAALLVALCAGGAAVPAPGPESVAAADARDRAPGARRSRGHAETDGASASGHPHRHADADRRPAGRGGLSTRSPPSPNSSSRSRKKARRSPSGPRRGCCSTTTTSTWRAAAGTRIRSGSSPTRCAATAANSRQNDNFAVVLDTFHDRRNGFLFYCHAGRRHARCGDDATSGQQLRLEHRLGRRKVTPVRRRLDRRDGHPVQVAALQARPRADLGHQAAARRSGARTRSAYITPTRSRVGHVGAFFTLSAAATLVGLEAPPPALNLEIKPYAMSRAHDRSA